MKFGIFLIASSPGGDHKRDFDDLIEQAVVAEELGYDSIWVAEHHSAYGMVGNPAVLLAAIAQRTERIRLGVGVSILPFQNPVRIAEDYAVVDVLSNGRLSFGAGRGSQAHEYYLMRSERERSKAQFWEAMDVILGLWNTDGPFSYEGQYFQFENIESFPRPLQRPVPVWVAAVSPETYAQTTERGLQVMVAAIGNDTTAVRERLAAGARLLIAQGRQPDEIDFPLVVNSYFAPTAAQAREDYKGAMWTMHELAPADVLGPAPKDLGTQSQEEERLRAYRDPDSYFDQAYERGGILVTDPEGARKYLRRLRDEIALRHFVTATAIGGLEHEQALRSMRLFAAEVMPEFLGETTPLPADFVPAGAAA